jgi:hypothetical protein
LVNCDRRVFRGQGDQMLLRKNAHFLSNIMQINFLLLFSVISCNRHWLLKVTQFAKNRPIWSPCLMLLYPNPGVYSAETFRMKNHTIQLLDVWFLCSTVGHVYACNL